MITPGSPTQANRLHAIPITLAKAKAEEGIDMETIAAFLGHRNPKITRETYARFSPDYLRGPAAALELPGLGPAQKPRSCG